MLSVVVVESINLVCPWYRLCNKICVYENACLNSNSDSLIKLPSQQRSVGDVPVSVNFSY